MNKRTLIIGTYNTAEHGWTLSSLKLGDAVMKTNYVEKPGGDGTWDLSTVMTDGEPRYKNRELSAVLECSEGTRATREELINSLVNQLDGWEWSIVLPDRPDHYLTGRVHVAVNYSDMAHASVSITATCEPWLYLTEEVNVVLTATSTEQSKVITNSGRRAVVPKLTVEGTVKLTFGTTTAQMTAGSYEWPAMLLTSGDHVLKYSGSGAVGISYREAVLR